jgi:predicted negative regulator of RcsB-dependent stress response
MAVAVAVALAQDEGSHLEDETIEELVTGQAPSQPLDLPVQSATSERLETPRVVAQAAQALEMDIGTVQQLYDGIDRVYLRDYAGARDIWAAFEAQNPATPVVDMGQVLIYQSLMMENFDFKYDGQYWHHSRVAAEKLERALKVPGNDAFETFLLAGIVGIEGVHLMRQGEFVSAFARGVEALRVVDDCQALAPDFVDPILADGIYNYWRTAVAQSTRLIPSFGDKRALGISQMEIAAQGALWVGPAAYLAMAYAYIEEREYDQALVVLERIRQRYPDNVINLLLQARVHLHLGELEAAQLRLDTVARVSPENQRQHYYQATVYLRQRRIEDGLVSIDTFLSLDLEDLTRAAGLSRKADLLFRLKDYTGAESYYQQAVDLTGFKPAKKRLKKMAKWRREGRID